MNKRSAEQQQQHQRTTSVVAPAYHRDADSSDPEAEETTKNGIIFEDR